MAPEDFLGFDILETLTPLFQIKCSQGKKMNYCAGENFRLENHLQHLSRAKDIPISGLALEKTNIDNVNHFRNSISFIKCDKRTPQSHK